MRKKDFPIDRKSQIKRKRFLTFNSNFMYAKRKYYGVLFRFHVNCKRKMICRPSEKPRKNIIFNDICNFCAPLFVVARARQLLMASAKTLLWICNINYTLRQSHGWCFHAMPHSQWEIYYLKYPLDVVLDVVKFEMSPVSLTFTLFPLSFVLSNDTHTHNGAPLLASGWANCIICSITKNATYGYGSMKWLPNLSVQCVLNHTIARDSERLRFKNVSGFR